MYAIIKDIHNVLRWIVLLVGLWAVVRAWWGLLARREWVKWDRRAGVFFSSALDIQLLLGVVLYFINPLIQIAYQDFGAAMGAAVSRFFTVEHVTYACAALVLAHLGNAATKKAPTTSTRFRRSVLLFTLALVVLLLGIPWPWLEVGRPLLPGFLIP
jgi:hypothetical protein